MSGFPEIPSNLSTSSSTGSPWVSHPAFRLTRCPVIVAVGEAETQAFHEQSRAFVDRLEREGWPCQLLVQPNVDHFAIVMSMAEPDAPLVRAIARQMALGAAPA